MTLNPMLTSLLAYGSKESTVLVGISSIQALMQPFDLVSILKPRLKEPGVSWTNCIPLKR